jgi:hypothetical protein
MGKKKDKIQAPMGETKVLLHTCCAPCSSAIIEAMLQNGITPVIYYCNPNIYPYEEYLIRKNECTRYAESLGLEIIDDDYDHEGWLQAVKGMENEPERGGRCLKCFKIRLLRTAEYAAKVDAVYEAGQDAMWDNIQNYGARTDYGGAFQNWRVEEGYLTPKHKVIPTTDNSRGSTFYRVNNGMYDVPLAKIGKEYFDFS